MDTVT